MGEEDQQYARATKAVDDAMRTDVLGMNVCKVLKEHNPTSEQVRKMIVDAINGDVDVRKALASHADEQAIARKGKGLSQVQAIALTALITLVITLVGTAIYVQVASQLSSKTPQATTQK